MSWSSKLKNLTYSTVIAYSASLLSFLILVMLVRAIGAEQYYLVAMGLAAGGILMPLTNLSAARTFVRDTIVVSDQELSKIVSHILSAQLTVTAIALIATLLASYFVDQHWSNRISFVLYGIWMGITGLAPSSWYDLKNRTLLQNSLNLGERLISIAAIAIVSMLPVEKDLILILGSILLIIRVLSTVTQVLLWNRLYGHGKLVIRVVFPSLNSKGISVVVTLTLVATAILTHGNQLILGLSPEKGQLAAYSLAFQMVSLIFLCQTQILRVANTWISKTCIDQLSIIKHLFYSGGSVAAFSLVLGGLLMLLTPALPALFNDPRFIQISNHLPVLCCWMTLVGFGRCVTQYLLELHLEANYLITGLSGGLLALLMGFLFVPKYGATAVGIILLLSHLLMISVNFMHLIKHVNRKSKLRLNGAVL